MNIKRQHLILILILSGSIVFLLHFLANSNNSLDRPVPFIAIQPIPDSHRSTIGPKSPITTSTNNSVNVLRIERKNHNFTAAKLNANGQSMTIFVYGSFDMISSSLMQHSVWEAWLVREAHDYLRRHARAMLIDIGCNLGVYTLAAAAMGRAVVAVDANRNNTDRLMQSIVANHVQDRVTLILNAVSNVRQSFSMERQLANIGSQGILEYVPGGYRVTSILVDDLLAFVPAASEVVMKIDIESHEEKAMRRASKLFDNRIVRAVLMEWEYVKRTSNVSLLIDFFVTRNYSAHKNFFTTDKLALSDFMSWPMDIVWRRPDS